MDVQSPETLKEPRDASKAIAASHRTDRQPEAGVTRYDALLFVRVLADEAQVGPGFALTRNFIGASAIMKTQCQCEPDMP